MKLGEIVKEYRNKHDISMDEFAKRSSLSKGYISMLEKNKRPGSDKPIIPSIETINKVAIAMNTDFNVLFNRLDKDQEIFLGENNDYTFRDTTDTHAVKIKVLGKVAAGIPIEAIEDFIGEEEITMEMANTGSYFGLKIQGDSMSPDILDGDTVIVRQQNDAESGDIVIVYVNGYDATCKRLRKYRDGIELVPINPSYDTKFYSDEDIEKTPVKIIGRVVESRRKF